MNDESKIAEAIRYAAKDIGLISQSITKGLECVGDAVNIGDVAGAIDRHSDSVEKVADAIRELASAIREAGGR